MSRPHCCLSSAISSVMFNFFMSSSTTLLQVFFGLSTGLLPSISSSIALLNKLFSSLHFTWPNYLNLVFLNLCSRYKRPTNLSGIIIISTAFSCTCHPNKNEPNEHKIRQRRNPLTPVGLNQVWNTAGCEHNYMHTIRINPSDLESPD